MKVPVILECLIICTLLAFVASKSVERRYGRGQPLLETTTVKLLNTSLTSSVENSVRQDGEDVSSNDVQVVQDLTDSQEQPASPVEQSDPVVSSNEAQNEVQNDVVKPVETNEIEPKPTTEKPINENDPNPINKFCSCSSASCKCCRDFSIPLVPIRGPGCATVRYLDNDRLSIGIKYGDFVLASRTVDSRRPSPICLPLPGGYNRFCGRIYGISRQDENFKACLGLELRADDDVEASLRVSCFQFGPRGLATMEAEPLPPNLDDDDEDDDDDDDPLGLDALGGDDDDDDDDEEDSDEAPGPGGIVGDVLGGILGGGGGGGGDDDDDDFGFTRFFNTAGDFVTDFFGGDSTAKDKKKPSDGISVDSKNDEEEKTKKKPEIVKKTAKNSASKLKAEEKEGSFLEEALEELTKEDEQSDVTTEDNEESKDAEPLDEKQEPDDDYEDEEEDEEDDEDDDDDYKEDEAEKNKDEAPESKPTKKKKATSSYGFGFFGRFFNLFS